MFHNMYEQVLRAHRHEEQAMNSPRSASHDARARRLSRRAERATRETLLEIARAH